MSTEGLPRARLRRVARALETGPASLYVYVANTTELHAAVLGELTGRLPAVESGAGRHRLTALLDGYTKILFGHPGLARSAWMLRATGPNMMVLLDLLDGWEEGLRRLIGNADTPLTRVASTLFPWALPGTGCPV